MAWILPHYPDEPAIAATNCQGRLVLDLAVHQRTAADYRSVSSQGRCVMKQRATDEEIGPETEVRITWRQWQDGRWEARLTDGSGRPPHLVRDRVELEWFLAQAYRRGVDGHRGEPDSRND